MTRLLALEAPSLAAWGAVSKQGVLLEILPTCGVEDLFHDVPQEGAVQDGDVERFTSLDGIVPFPAHSGLIEEKGLFPIGARSQVAEIDVDEETSEALDVLVGPLQLPHVREEEVLRRGHLAPSKVHVFDRVS